MQYLTGAVVTDFSGTASISKGSSDSQSNLSLRLGEFLLANLFITVDLNLASKMTIYAEKARIEIPNFWKTQEATIFYLDGGEEKITGDFSSEFAFEVDHVNHCLENQQIHSPVMTKELTLSTVSLVEDMYNQWLAK